MTVEYYTATLESVTVNSHQAILERMGKAGWKLVQIIDRAHGTDYIFMREKPSPFGPSETKEYRYGP